MLLLTFRAYNGNRTAFLNWGAYVDSGKIAIEN